MTETTKSTTSLSGTIEQILTALQGKAPTPYTVISGEGHDVFYNLQSRSMTRVRCGTPVVVVENYPEDEQGRVVVQTLDGDIVRVEKDRVLSLGFH